MKLRSLLVTVIVLGACTHAPPRDDAVADQVRRALHIALPRAQRWGALAAPLTITIRPTHDALTSSHIA